MQSVPSIDTARVVPLPVRARSPLPEASAADEEFVSMLHAFRGTGGLARGDEVAGRLMERGTGDVSRLARWIVAREVVGIDWGGELWVPLFQFEPRTMTLRPEVQQVFAELTPVYDAWGLAEWFATPNGWLGEQAPVDVLAADRDAVIDAARADRFALAG